MMPKLHLFHTLPIQVWLYKESLLKLGFFWLLLAGFLFHAESVQGGSLYIGKPGAAGEEVPAPVQLVEAQTNILLSQLSTRKKEFDNNPKSLVFFARHVALSHWDLRKTSRLMLGKHWKIAKPAQQNRFEEEFLRTLLRYVVKAYGYYDDSLVEIESYDWQPKRNGGWVRSQVRLPAGLKVSVDYRMNLDYQKQWKMIDVRVEGISLVHSKRSEYRDEISEHGMDALVQQMYDKNQKVLAKL